MSWSARFSICCFLDNNRFPSPYHQYEAVLAAGVMDSLTCNAGDALEQLKAFHDRHKDWLFGHLGYDLKNETGNFSSDNFDGIHLPDLFFFQPEIVLLADEKSIQVGVCERDGSAAAAEQAALEIWREIISADPAPGFFNSPGLTLQSRMSGKEYMAAVRGLQHHIHIGNCYEVNCCREFFAVDAVIEPLPLFNLLNKLSPSPLAAWYRLKDKYLLCASPERFLKKTGTKIISQPIKGTAKRAEDSYADDRLKNALLASRKERAENVMIVDLVRNDLSRTALTGTVVVEELYGIYSFARVHHLISTIVSEQDPQYHFTDIIRHAFPMGSMTGAPKIKVMQLIEAFEKTKRGLFSGSVGYITPGGDIDFNVVIRSILYNETDRYLSFQTGAAITFYSDPQKELEECLLKAAAMKELLEA